MKPRAFFALPFTIAAATLLSACAPEPGMPAPEAAYQGLVQEYLETWTDFYPSRAVALGLHLHLAQAEDRQAEVVEHWLSWNRQVLDSILRQPEALPVDLRIDLRLLENRVRGELRSWGNGAPLRDSPSVYTRTVGDLMRIPEEVRGFTGEELEEAVANRITAAGTVARDLRAQLRTGPRQEVYDAARSLRGARENLQRLADRFPGLDSVAEATDEDLLSATAYLAEEVERTDAPGNQILGRDRYARELELYYGMRITPEEVASQALREMESVRDLIIGVSREYWLETYPQEPLPESVEELVERVSAEMENNRASSEQEALENFTRYAQEAEAFVAEAGLATLPPDRTLEIRLTPESAGPMQRIGSVDSPPPFDPDPMTVLSIPTIPDTFPAREKEDFYRSFNNHFNKSIIIHELFPGHYMQLKIASSNPRWIRSFFPYEPYIEGWATLVETFALDAGWDDFNKLTYLAHLRKRLENANRAYTSVQVHCFDWDEERVREFSRKEAFLAPQFAESLWGRLLRSPMQMTSYFMGKEMFMDVLEEERARLGEGFDLRTFNDIILEAGAVPIDMIPDLLRESREVSSG